MFPAIPQDSIHPALLQYMQDIRDGDIKIRDSSALLDTGPSKADVIMSGHGLGPSTSSRVPPEMPGAVRTSVGAPPAQQLLPQIPTESQLWSSFDRSTQSPSTRGNPDDATYSLDSFPDFDSIFRFQTPSLYTQYPQLSPAARTLERTPTAGPSPSSNDSSRGFGIGETRVEDTRVASELYFTRCMAEDVSGFSADGMGSGWEAFLAGWRP